MVELIRMSDDGIPQKWTFTNTGKRWVMKVEETLVPLPEEGNCGKRQFVANYNTSKRAMQRAKARREGLAQFGRWLKTDSTYLFWRKKIDDFNERIKIAESHP